MMDRQNWRPGAGAARTENRPWASLRPDLMPACRAFMSRDQLFAGLFVLVCANGLARRVFGTLGAASWFDPITATFGVSAIVWVACFGALTLVLRKEGSDDIHPADLIVGAVIFLLVALPFGAPNWWALSLLAIYVVWHSRPYSTRRRGALIFLAITVPMYWGPLLMEIFPRQILEADALITSQLIGTERIGNRVMFSDGSRYFQIWQPCSSLANMSLAFVAWMTVSQVIGRRWSPQDLVWCALATFAVFAVNVTRLSLIGLYREHFDLLHGPIGEEVSHWLSLGLIVTICWLGVRRDISARA